MNNKIYAFDKFSDSYIMYNKKKPMFLTIILLLLSVLIIGFFTWSGIVYKKEIVKTQAIFDIENKTFIMPKTNGVVKEVFVKDGETVEKGEILIQFDTSEIDAKIAQYDSYLSGFTVRKNLFEQLISNIKDNKSNDFDDNDFTELEFYNYMEDYIAQKELYALPEQQENFKRQTLNTYIAERNNVINQINQYEAEKNSYSISKNNYVITAENNGKVVLNGKVTVGMVLSAGASIGSVISNDEELYLSTYISVSDRPKIAVGNAVQVVVAGLSQNEYGSINGELVSISEDAISNEQNMFYTAKIKIDKQSIYSSNRDEIKLLVGMGAETRIVFKQTTYLKYFLEQLGIKIK